MRSNIYDGLQGSLQTLKQTTVLGDKILKSDDITELKFENYVPVHNHKKNLAADIYNQFRTLRSDWTEKKINAARYRNGLQKFKDFFANAKGDEAESMAPYKKEIMDQCDLYCF